MSKALATAPTAADVRALFRSNETRMGRLSEAAQATVREGARGRLHPDAIKEFNKGRKPGRRYVLGATKDAKAAQAALRVKAAEAGLPVGKRGPLSREAKVALGLSKA